MKFPGPIRTGVEGSGLMESVTVPGIRGTESMRALRNRAAAEQFAESLLVTLKSMGIVLASPKGSGGTMSSATALRVIGSNIWTTGSYMEQELLT